LVWLGRGRDRSKLDWLIKLLVVALYSSYIFLVGRWDLFSYYLRFILIVLFFLAAFKSYKKVKALPVYPTKNFQAYLSLGVNFFVLIIFAFFNTSALKGYFFDGNPIQLSFPLNNGIYYVARGGNSPVINYHNTNRAQKYALDIVKLNLTGTRANGIYPKDLTKYTIFGDTLYSPCDGNIKNLKDGLPDLIPPEMERKNPAGNHVLIECKSTEVLVAHLLKGSVTVNAGELVKTGQAIAKIGNSGNTSEPHLHIHARKSITNNSILGGEGVPIVFNGRFLVRNSLVY
jgi:hypothetical protein